ncbi:uncharacterized protein LOC108149112 [Drosophila elegans]|uniref:uncharacterized protein LOC108149112 n=1 Tax=Drosophila elegans TaxID=30023 RepID=UPI0007E7A163|nr:uncharacterized protein LOC108149112 [Drosophila elegans]
MGWTIGKCCCCELKWGALIVAIVDMIMSAAVILETKYLAYYQSWLNFVKLEEHDHMGTLEIDYDAPSYYVWMVTLVIHFAHLVACVLVIVSVWMQIKKFVLAYLTIGIVRITYDLMFFIYVCVEVGAMAVTLLLIFAGFGVAIFFWFVAYSWFKMLGSSTRVD